MQCFITRVLIIHVQTTQLMDGMLGALEMATVLLVNVHAIMQWRTKAQMEWGVDHKHLMIPVCLRIRLALLTSLGVQVIA